MVRTKPLCKQVHEHERTSQHLSGPLAQQWRSLSEYINLLPLITRLTSYSREQPLKAVQLEALVVMKVIKHCSSRFPTTATGSLVGMDVNGILEVTNSFPFPVVDLPPEAQFEQQHFNSAAAAPRAKSNASYQTEMIRMLREVNVDANNIGWYTSANLGNFINSNFIDNQYYYQKDLNERTIALVHDVSRSSQGALSLRAFRLSPHFMSAFKENKFTTEKYAHQALFLLKHSLTVLQPPKVRPEISRHPPRTPNPDSQLPPRHNIPPPSPQTPHHRHHVPTTFLPCRPRTQPRPQVRYTITKLRSP